MVAGLVVIICMFLNWFPADLDLGVVQIDEVLGKVNAFTFAATIRELEDHLGMLASVLPEAYGQLKTWSIVLAGFAVVTISVYISAFVLRVLRKNKYVNLLSVAASVFAVATSYIFYSIACNIYNNLSITALGYSVMNVVAKSPCTIVALAGVVSIALTDPVTAAIGNMVDGVITAIIRFVNCIAEWVKLIINNIGYVLSDIAGGFVGICVTAWLLNMTGSALLAVIGGLVAAGGVAITCMIFVCRIILRNK